MYNENQAIVFREQIIKISKSANYQKDHLWYWNLVAKWTRFMKQAQELFLLHAQTQIIVL